MSVDLTHDEAVQLLLRLDWPAEPHPALVTGRDKLYEHADATSGRDLQRELKALPGIGPVKAWFLAAIAERRYASGVEYKSDQEGIHGDEGTEARGAQGRQDEAEREARAREPQAQAARPLAHLHVWEHESGSAWFVCSLCGERMSKRNAHLLGGGIS